MNSDNNLRRRILKFIYKEEYVAQMEEKIEKRKETKRNKKREDNDLTIKEVIIGFIALTIIIVLLVIRF